MKFWLKIQIFIWGMGVAIVAGIACAGVAVADGYNPHLIRDAETMCTIASGVDRDVAPMIGLFDRYGAQYVADTINAVCPQNNMKVLVALKGVQQLHLDIRR